jgi:DNA-binding NarL/FixJ family response regulator
MLNHNHGGGVDTRSAARVLLSGDHPMIRSAIGMLIAGDGIVVVGECFNRPDVLRRGLGAGIDLVLLDFDLDGGTTALFDSLVAVAGACPILVLTRGADPEVISLAFYKGVAGVVLKSRPAEVLLRAIRAVLADGVFLERTTAAGVFRPAPSRAEVEPSKLTRRESEVVELVSLGLQNKKIAERLSIRETTVRHHLTSIFDKLALTNRMELMRYAYREADRGSDTSYIMRG